MVCPELVESEISHITIRNPQLPRQDEGANPKMSTSRCVYLMAKAMHYRWSEIWISDQPFLLMTYLNVYFPWVSRMLMTHVIGPARIKTLQTGGNVWDIQANFGL